MLHQPPPPTGPRASGRLASSRLSSGGGIQKRSTTPARVDKDGDLVMDQAGTNGRASGRGRGAASRHVQKEIVPSTLRKTYFLRGIGSSEMAPKELRSSARTPRDRAARDRAALERISSRLADEKWDHIAIKGLEQSKAAANPGGGISELISFLERKATHPPDAPEAVKIMKVCLTLHSARQLRHQVSKLSGPPSFQAKLSKRRPRFYATALG